MTRNRISQEVSSLIAVAEQRASALNNPEAWALVGSLERFSCDLCNAPSSHNDKMGVTSYTIKTAQKALQDFKKQLA